MESTDALIDGWIRKGSTPGVSYVHFDRQQPIHERYAGLADIATARAVVPATSYHGFSVTKTMTALAVLQLAQVGRLKLQDLVRDHLPGFPYAEDVSVWHLLTHTAGLPNPLPLSWVHTAAEHASFDRDAFFAPILAKHARLRSTPGTRMAYSNLGYHLLGQVIEQISASRYEEVVRKAILEPAGIAPDEVCFDLPADEVHATGYLRTPSFLSILLSLRAETRKHLGQRSGHWRAFDPILLNGAAYGGSLGTATGYRKYLQALLTDDLLLNNAWRTQFFTGSTLGGRPSGMALSWFTGSLKGHAYVAHAGGGAGYYSEIRLYPSLGRGSVVLFNRTGIRDERLLDKLDREFVR